MKKHKGQYYGGFTKMDIKLINKQVLEDKLYLLSLGAILSFWLPHIRYPNLNIKVRLFSKFLNLIIVTVFTKFVLFFLPKIFFCLRLYNILEKGRLCFYRLNVKFCV